jgi:methyl-accepting chemotaxis protein
MMNIFSSILRYLMVRWNALAWGLSRTQLSLGAILILIGLLRFFNHQSQLFRDDIFGRPGDSLLLLFAIMMALVTLFVRDAVKPTTLTSSTDPVADVLRSHLKLDAEISIKLKEVVEDTEHSALKIIAEVRQLYDTANTSVNYMDESSVIADALGQEVISTVSHLRGLENFVLQLPGQMKSDLENVQLISKEIKVLSGLVDSVKAISMQSHLLSINAAIEGSRAGPSGASFRVVAGEMRKLALNSHEVASQISQGLLRANLVVTGGIASGIADASERLEDVLAATDSIQMLQDNVARISDFYNSRFQVITKNNKDLAFNISEVLGQIQYQDVVSQCIDRMTVAISQRNSLLEDTALQLQNGDAEIEKLSQKIDLISQSYRTEEDKHMHSERHETAATSELKIELF